MKLKITPLTTGYVNSAYTVTVDLLGGVYPPVTLRMHSLMSTPSNVEPFPRQI